ncbi:TPA: putative phage abortive infection protein [Pseudomonas aeruginosa]
MTQKKLEEKLEDLTPKLLLKWLAWIFAIAAGAVGIVFLFYFMNFNNGFSTANADWGTFGDFIGGTLNPILSFLGLIALLLTIVLQSKELEATRTELARAASAQEKTENALKEQAKTQLRQQFESTFFSLLDQHNKALEKLSTISNKWTNSRSDLDIVKENVFKESVKNLAQAKDSLETQNNLCGHYFRTLYQTLKLIATSAPNSTIGVTFETNSIESTPINPDEKMYSNIVRSFLSYDATQLLAINCYCSGEHDTYWKFKLLIERYSFLEHMPFEINKSNNELLQLTKDFYSSKAFGLSQFS